MAAPSDQVIRVCSAIALVAMLGARSRGAAQASVEFPAVGEVEVTPYVGIYAPTAHLPPDLYASNPEQRPGPVLGGYLGRSITKGVGVDLAAGFAPSDVTGGGASSEYAYVLSVAGRLVGRVGARKSRWTLFAVAGPALLLHGGFAWEGYHETSAFGVDVGFGARLRMSEMVFRVELDDYVYPFDPVGPADPSGRLQNDLVLAIGVPMTPFRRLGGP